MPNRLGIVGVEERHEDYPTASSDDLTMMLIEGAGHADPKAWPTGLEEVQDTVTFLRRIRAGASRRRPGTRSRCC
jgi:hypothetical protein